VESDTRALVLVEAPDVVSGKVLEIVSIYVVPFDNYRLCSHLPEVRIEVEAVPLLVNSRCRAIAAFR